MINSNRQPHKRERRVRKESRLSAWLVFYFVISLLIPNVLLCCTEHYHFWTVVASFLIPAGFYMCWCILLRRSGIMIWAGIIFMFLSGFQIALLYLFGNSIIATDMFTNLYTTNASETGELLSNIYPSLILIGVLYVPLLWLATHDLIHKHDLARSARRNIARWGIGIMAAGFLALWPAYYTSTTTRLLRDDIFPVDVLYNAGLSAAEYHRTSNFPKTSAGFTYDAHRTAQADGREIYVYVIGEASRAMNWQLYGYSRETNPELTKTDGLVVFRNMLTQSNTTHKSVPMLLSSVDTDEHPDLYRRTGLPALFKEAGFTTYFISNQLPQGAMIDRFAKEADHLIYLDAPHYDMQLVDKMQQVIRADTAQKMLIILHSYGSHFAYHERYPHDFSRFLPDGDVAITEKDKQELINGYDNSILYTDHFLASTIACLRSLDSVSSALLYCADHGEDLLDDSRNRFLHASPTTTAYQIYVASLAWFSPAYQRNFPDKVAAAEANSSAPATSRAMFQTMADAASIEGKYLNDSVSLVSPDYDRSRPRYYLNDHNEAVPFPETGLTKEDLAELKKYGITLNDK